MLEFFLRGIPLGITPAVIPTPFKLFLFSNVLMKGWRRALPMSLSPLLADLPVVILVILVLGQIPSLLLSLLAVIGGLYSLWLAWRTFQLSQRGMALNAKMQSSIRNVLQGLMLVWVNPGVWLYWTLVGGPIFLQGWAISVAHALAFVLGMYGVFIPLLVVITILVEKAGGVSPQATRLMLIVASVAMAIQAMYQIIGAVPALIK
jgi:threonine/homoserine/homoserine lactone efflux protein